MSKECLFIRRTFVPSNKQIEKMKTLTNNLGTMLLFFPLVFSAQQAPNLQELIQSALSSDGTL